ncbi:5a973edc-6e7f-4564-880b-e9b99fd88e86 [Thermothielavioides terrestris]|uniref:5a973edc-6e7f-4564-880b-e9b99fd88e86 n=1 Tax=Thermothielavioides terrestris TaxID=2587410 RepID=A0A3S4AR01_9PEZI|nr:5a973edc-6e7f-4564-880b-e9b99fd88e86 [Thermothielavioides terrestris]
MSTADGASLDDEDRRAPNRLPPAFAGYRPFPPVLNLYGNPSGVIDALTTLKLCGAAKSDLLYIVESFIMLPPLDLEANPRDMVTEIMYATKTSDGAVSFRFAIEVGPKMKCREHFEWKKAGTDNGHSRYILVRLDPRAASPSPAPSAQDESEVLAELLFRNVMSWNHLFTLELKGAGGSGAMGDRWTLMVVVSALRLYWLRVYGKTNKSVVGIGQKFRGK